MKVLPCETNTKPFLFEIRVALLLATSLHILEGSGTLLLSKLFLCLRTFLFFSLEGSRFLHCFKLRCLAIDLTVNHFTKYCFAKYHFAKHHFANYHFVLYHKPEEHWNKF